MRTYTRGPRRGAVNDELFTRDSSLMHAGRFSRDVESIEEEARDAPALDRPKRRARSTEPGVGRARRDGANAGDGPTRVERPVRRLPSITHPSPVRDPPEKALFGMGPRVPPVPHTRVCANRPPVPPTRAPSAPTRRANARRRHPHPSPRGRGARLSRVPRARARTSDRKASHAPRANAPPSPRALGGPAASSSSKQTLRAVRARTAGDAPPRARWRRRRRRRPLRRRSPRPPASRARPRAARDGVVGVRASPSRPLLPRVVRVRARSARRAMSRATTNPAPGPPGTGIPGTRRWRTLPVPLRVRPPRGRVRRLVDARRRDARAAARASPLILRRRARVVPRRLVRPRRDDVRRRRVQDGLGRARPGRPRVPALGDPRARRHLRRGGRRRRGARPRRHVPRRAPRGAPVRRRLARRRADRRRAKIAAAAFVAADEEIRALLRKAARDRAEKARLEGEIIRGGALIDAAEREAAAASRREEERRNVSNAVAERMRALERSVERSARASVASSREAGTAAGMLARDVAAARTEAREAREALRASVTRAIRDEAEAIRDEVVARENTAAAAAARRIEEREETIGDGTAASKDAGLSDASLAEVAEAVKRAVAEQLIAERSTRASLDGGFDGDPPSAPSRLVLDALETLSAKLDAKVAAEYSENSEPGETSRPGEKTTSTSAKETVTARLDAEQWALLGERLTRLEEASDRARMEAAIEAGKAVGRVRRGVREDLLGVSEALAAAAEKAAEAEAARAEAARLGRAADEAAAAERRASTKSSEKKGDGRTRRAEEEDEGAPARSTPAGAGAGAGAGAARTTFEQPSNDLRASREPTRAGLSRPTAPPRARAPRSPRSPRAGAGPAPGASPRRSSTTTGARRRCSPTEAPAEEPPPAERRSSAAPRETRLRRAARSNLPTRDRPSKKPRGRRSSAGSPLPRTRARGRRARTRSKTCRRS